MKRIVLEFSDSQYDELAEFASSELECSASELIQELVLQLFATIRGETGETALESINSTGSSEPS